MSANANNTDTIIQQMLKLGYSLDYTSRAFLINEFRNINNQEGKNKIQDKLNRFKKTFVKNNLIDYYADNGDGTFTTQLRIFYRDSQVVVKCLYIKYDPEEKQPMLKLNINNMNFHWIIHNPAHHEAVLEDLKQLSLLELTETQLYEIHLTILAMATACFGINFSFDNPVTSDRNLIVRREVSDDTGFVRTDSSAGAGFTRSESKSDDNERIKEYLMGKGFSEMEINSMTYQQLHDTEERLRNREEPRNEKEKLKEFLVLDGMSRTRVETLSLQELKQLAGERRIRSIRSERGRTANQTFISQRQGIVPEEKEKLVQELKGYGKTSESVLRGMALNVLRAEAWRQRREREI